jgi:hypothetical protein
MSCDFCKLTEIIFFCKPKESPEDYRLPALPDDLSDHRKRLAATFAQTPCITAAYIMGRCGRTCFTVASVF